MKKNLLIGLVAVSALGLVACGGKKMKSVELKSDVDSVSYAIGSQNADQMLTYLPMQGRLDTTKIDQFVKGILDGIYENDAEDAEYAFGKQIGSELKGSLKDAELVPGDSTLKVNKDAFVNGLVETLKKEGKFTSDDAAEYVKNFFADYQKKSHADYIAKQEAFLIENAKNDSVKVTESGLQYKVITVGNGEIAGENTTVKVNYRGTLIDGTEFDSSYSRNEPFEFNTSGGVIPAWLEASKMMPIGSKWIIYCPAELAYGERETGKIPAFSTLIFEIEMLEIVK